MTTVFGSNSSYRRASRNSRVMLTKASVPLVSGARPMLISVCSTVSRHIWSTVTPSARVLAAPPR
jgi:hypothetical protein